MYSSNADYIVYKAVNKINGKIYIGATTRSLEERIKDHAQKAMCGKGSAFQKAIAKYNLDNFQWEEIDHANCLNDLAEKEKHYIHLYDSNHRGYNSDEGGGFRKIVYQYDTTGNMIASYTGLLEIEQRLHLDKRRISDACTHSTLFNGSFWSYTENSTFAIPTDHKKRGVLQFDLLGNLLNCFESVSEASRLSGLSKTCISRCCRGERDKSGGYIWKYK